MAGAGGSSSAFGGNDEILDWLDVLLKGKPGQQAVARTEIAMILEARGFADEAEEAYWTNVQARCTDRRSYERLIALYQLRKDKLSESLVRKQLEEVFSAPEPPMPARAPRSAAPRPTAPPEPGDTPVSLARQLTSPNLPGTAPSPGQPIRRLRSARRPDEPTPAADDRSVLSLAAPAGSPSEPSPARSRTQDVSPERDIAASVSQPLQATEVLPSQSYAGAANGRRRARLSPNPGRSYRGYGSSAGGLIVLRPATIAAFVLASIGAAALIVFLFIWSDRGTMSRLSNAATSQVSTRCVDGSVRFPGASDPRGAVASAYRQQGVDVEAGRPGNPRLTVDQAEQVIGGWIGASLMLEHAGQPAPKLNEWLDTDSPRPTLANAILAGRRLDTMLSPEEWSEIQSWPASTCEGAFVKDPRNAALLRLVERVVAR